MLLNHILKFIPLPIIYLFVLSFFIWVVYSNIDDFSLIVDAIQGIDIVLFIYTLLLGIGSIAILSLILKHSFSLISSRDSFPRLFDRTLTFQFINISTPMGLMGGTAYLVKYLTSLGITHIRAFFGVTINNLAINISYLIILTFTILFISSTNDLLPYQEFASILIILLTLATAIPLLFLIVLPRFSIKLSHFIVSIINGFTSFILRKNIIDIRMINEYIYEAINISKGFSSSIKAFSRVIPISITYHLICVSVLFVSFLSLGVTLDVFQAISLYGIIYLFTVISPTPYGIGIVEGLAHVAAINMELDPSLSLVAIIIYRFSVLWLPSVIGLFTLKNRN
jgi:glycosyltransferase 2 family protein